jgi:hypothetical protein
MPKKPRDQASAFACDRLWCITELPLLLVASSAKSDDADWPNAVELNEGHPRSIGESKPHFIIEWAGDRCRSRNSQKQSP